MHVKVNMIGKFFQKYLQQNTLLLEESYFTSQNYVGKALVTIKEPS